MNKQEFSFEKLSRRKSFKFKQVIEIFDIDFNHSIDISEQTINQMNQVNQVNQMNQVKQLIRRPRDRPLSRKRERDDREDYKYARKGAANVHIKDLRLSIDYISIQIKR